VDSVSDQIEIDVSLDSRLLFYNGLVSVYVSVVPVDESLQKEETEKPNCHVSNCGGKLCFTEEFHGLRQQIQVRCAKDGSR
jgi:hypothetical protein